MLRSRFACVFAIVVVAGLIEKANAIDCYVCRSCAEVGPADVQTCPSTVLPTTEEPIFSTLEPTTDQDMHFDLPVSGGNVQVVDIPFLEDQERASSRTGFVLDDSPLPGSEFLTRSLKQYSYRSEGDEARCVIAVFEENGQLDVVRGCSTASDNQETRCGEAIGNGFAGTMKYCNLCEDDLCNSASKSVFALFLVIAGVLVNIKL